MIEHLTVETFKTKVFDYEKNTEWKFNGNKPAIIDFYADWCGPCKTLAPIIKQFCENNKLTLESINVEDNDDLVQKYKIRNIPVIVFEDLDGKELKRLVGMQTQDNLTKVYKEIMGTDA